MDVCGSLHKQSPTEKPRPPLVSAEKNNALNTVSTRRPRIREVDSRYKSPSQSMASSTRRCPSPSPARTLPLRTQLGSKRALSAERKRPSTPPSPPSPTTPVNESSVDGTQLSSRKLSGGGRLPESLWPSTMRSLSVSFQSDTISVPVTKKEKPVTNVALDRTLKPSSNVAHKQGEMHGPLSRKPTPERKRSPLKGKNAPDQSENSKPVDGLQTRLIDQHRWPSRIGGKVAANPSAKSVDLLDKIVRNPGTSGQGIGVASMRRRSLDGLTKPLQKSSSDAASRLLSFVELSKVGSVAKSVDDTSLQVSGSYKLTSIGLSEISTSVAAAVRSHTLPLSRSRPASPSRTSVLQSSRGVSPSRVRPSTPPPRGISPSRVRPSTPPPRGISPSPARPSTPPSRGISPSRIRSSTTASQSSSSTSVLSFIADVKKGKKSIDDAHHLRLLYNRYLQWRFANAQGEAVLYNQKIMAEETLYNVWDTTLNLWESVMTKRINLQQQNLELKLNAVLNNQMAYLDEWASIERDHISSLTGVVEDLEASTCRVPITGGARADVESLKGAVWSAVDVMQSMGSSICSLLSRLERMSSLVSELAVVTAQGKAMLDECEALLASTAAMLVEEYSLRTQLIQKKQILEKG